MGRRAIVDTNVLYILLLGGEEEAKRLATLLEAYRPTITPIIAAELLHVLTLRYLKKKDLARGAKDMRRYIARKGYPQEVLRAINDLLEAVDPETLPEPPASWRRIIEVAEKHRVLSNDAIIALTALEHGIDAIISLDEDFDRIPWLQRIH